MSPQSRGSHIGVGDGGAGDSVGGGGGAAGVGIGVGWVGDGVSGGDTGRGGPPGRWVGAALDAFGVDVTTTAAGGVFDGTEVWAGATTAKPSTTGAGTTTWAADSCAGDGVVATVVPAGDVDAAA